MNKFNTLNIENDILKGIEKKQYEEMTEVQENVIPIALQGVDLIAQAPTGTGKTAAFAIPILQNIDADLNKVQALILSPTRELAVQITKEIQEMSFFKDNIRVVTVYGGEYIEKQITALRRKPQIVVATPGRLMDHMRRGTISLNDVSLLVLDEADEMLNMGFREDLDVILKDITHEHQTMLFSATISKEIEKIANTYLNNPQIVRVKRKEEDTPAITQKYIEVKSRDKIEVISRIIDIDDYKLIMVFCNTKRAVDEVTSSLLARGFMVEALHGDMKQMQRDRVMNRFRSGNLDILVASDVAARGLDVDDVDVVFNYDVPTDEEYYVHRIGRTGRAKRTGLAITLLTKQEKYRLRGIMAYSNSVITAMDIPSLDKVMKVRVERVLKQALEAKNNKYQEIIDKTLVKMAEDNIDPSQLITGLVMLQLNVGSEEEIREDSGRKSNTSRIFFGMGRKDNIKVFDLAEMIISRTSLTNADINKIDLHENFSFFEIPSKFVDELVFAFAGNVNGRRVIVEEAKAKRSDGSRDRSRSGSRGDSRGSSSRGERSSRPRSDAPRGERSSRSRSDAPRGDRPSRSRSDAPRSERSSRSRSDAPRSERSSRSRSDAPRSERSSRSRSDSPRKERSSRSRSDNRYE